MPIVMPDRATAIADTLLQCAGASAHEAEIVARHCIGANLAGHDSHGIIQIPVYIDRVDKGHIVPGAPIDIVQESPASTVIDGNWGFGYVVSEHAMKLTIEKAKKSNVAACTVFRQSHVGRVADYPLMAAKEGMIAIMTADSGRAPKQVAPFGGREPRLGTNPISVAVPSELEGPLFIDMATSAAAAGKLKVAAARGTPIPEGWLLDKEGRQTTDPRALGQGGVLLPLGGGEGYKGYGLSAIVEILSGILPGLGFGVEPTGKHNDGVFMAVFNVDAFRPIATFKREVTEFAEYLKATPPDANTKQVLYPGEVEHMRAEQRGREGLDIEDKTWGELKALAEKYGVADKLGMQG